MWKKIYFRELSGLKSIREGESVPDALYESIVVFSKDLSLWRVDFGGAERVYTDLGRQKNSSHKWSATLF
jgi:hypothetical protein